MPSRSSRRSPGACTRASRAQYQYTLVGTDAGDVAEWSDKLAQRLRQDRRLLDVAEHLPPIELVLQAADLTDLAETRPSGSYLLPCRGGGVTVDGARTAYLDERPPQDNWTLIGCERSAQIHEWFYGERAEQVDFCPRKAAHIEGAVLTKCCLLERDIAVEDGQVTVPWGASLAQISEALTVLARDWEPTWAPA